MTIRLPPKKNKPIVFHTNEAPKTSVFDERVGTYVSKAAFTFMRYNLPVEIAIGQKVVSLEDKGHKVLVEFKTGTCLYMESETFDENFVRA